MRFLVRRILFGALALGLASTMAATGQTMDTPARHAILVDLSTGSILFEKEADVPFPPASMGKMMTVYVAMQMIRDEITGLEDEVTMSVETYRKWRLQGSTMYLEPDKPVTVADLLRGIIVLSGNDATVVLAEALAGTEETFAIMMNQAAEDMGLTNSHFVNSNGWPAEGQYVSARDLATIATRTIEDFPELYAMYSERSFAFGPPANQNNRNPLLGRVEGADGLKTGHTEEAGYGLTGSAIRDGRRLVLVVSGLSSQNQRRRESQRLIEYGFRSFKTYELFAAGETVAAAKIWLGAQAEVPMVVENDVRLTLTRPQRNRMVVKYAYEQPTAAPIVQGAPIGTLHITAPDREELVIPLLAGQDVEEISGFGRISEAFLHLLFGGGSN